MLHARIFHGTGDDAVERTEAAINAWLRENDGKFRDVNSQTAMCTRWSGHDHVIEFAVTLWYRTDG